MSNLLSLDPSFISVCMVLYVQQYFFECVHTILFITQPTKDTCVESETKKYSTVLACNS